MVAPAPAKRPTNKAWAAGLFSSWPSTARSAAASTQSFNPRGHARSAPHRRPCPCLQIPACKVEAGREVTQRTCRPSCSPSLSPCVRRCITAAFVAQRTHCTRGMEPWRLPEECGAWCMVTSFQVALRQVASKEASERRSLVGGRSSCHTLWVPRAACRALPAAPGAHLLAARASASHAACVDVLLVPAGSLQSVSRAKTSSRPPPRTWL